MSTALPWVLCAHDELSLREHAGVLRAHLEARPQLEFADVGWSLVAGRTHLQRRAVAVGEDRAALLAALGAIAAGQPAPGVARGSAGPPGTLAFVFPGQGSQWPGMALDLAAASPIFAESLQACEAALAPHIEWKLDDVLRAAPDDPLWERSDIVQPSLFCVMVSLAALWRCFGVRPGAVVGHSLGEISAACVAGILSLEDAGRVAALTSRALHELGGDDGMVLVDLAAAQLEDRIAGIDGRLTLAAFNGPHAIVVAGEQPALDALLTGCEADGIRARRIRVDGTSSVAHSSQIEAIRERLARDLAPVAPRPSGVTFYSSVTGEPIDYTELGAEYWYRSLRQPVRFEQAARALVRDGAAAFVESSPHPVLTFAVEGTIEAAPRDRPVAVIGSLRRDGGLARFLTSLGEAHAAGVAVDWAPAFAAARPRRVELPALRSPPAAPEEPPAAPPAQSLLSASDREDQALLALVREHAAAVLGLDSPAAIAPRRAFRELNMESLQGVELRNRLAQVTGLRLPSTLVYDHPTPAAVAGQLAAILSGAQRGTRATVRARAHHDEPIAIVGMSCRYPGGVQSAQDLWDLVASGTDAIGPFPTDRGWDLDELYDPDPDATGKSYVQAGGFLYDAPDFDAAFFAIAPREASVMDPQQRLVLETSWAALEDAAIDPERLAGSATGVFLGVSSQDYGSFLPGFATEYEGLRMTGALTSVVSGRVSYALGLQGPGITVDTACSSSLVALHLACQALRSGECSLALAGGVTVLSSPGMFVEFSRQRGLAPDGRSKAFAAAADGASWAEGAGVLVVERLSDARRSGHRVLGLVRGTATNQDGASNGLSAPNGPSQEQVIRQALANAGLRPGDVDAVEAHGTGTTLGDPIEAGALLATYGQERTDGPLWLGSIKSNIGHSHAAAGVAGVIKMVMAMSAGILAPTLHVDAPTPHVDWAAGEIALLTEAVDWPRTGRPRRAGVSGFGISGTNAHLVLEEAPPDAEHGRQPPMQPPAVPWVLSARSEGALRAQARRLRAHLDARPQLAAVDVGWSLACGRARLAHRATIVGADRATLLGGLDAVAGGMPEERVASGAAPDRAKVAFVFPGQGSQWLGMALDLWDASDVFGAQMQACADALAPHTGWDLREVIGGAPGAPALERMDVVQPASFAIFVSLAALWRSYGVQPSVVVGHSQGEIAAAHVAGALSLDDAARVAALRSAALVQLAGGGAMMSIFLPAGDVLERIGRFGGRISLASYNSPRSTVVSGEPRALGELLEQCEAAGERARMIAVDYASHSAQIETIRERLLDDLGPIAPVSAPIPILSTTTAALIDGAQLGAEHWYRNLREPVRFEQATRALADDGITAFIELSPHPVLTWAVQETIDAAAPDPGRVAVVGSLRRGEGTPARFLTSAGEAFAGGVEIDWEAAFAGTGARRVGLPTYPFERTRFWFEQATSARDGAPSLSAAGIGSAEHPLLGAAVELAGRDGCLLTGRIALSSHPWLADHELFDAVTLAQAAFAEMALRAGAEVGCGTVEQLTLATPLQLPAQGGVQLQVTVGAADDRRRRALEVHARLDGEDAAWVRHATGMLSPRAAPDHAPLPQAWPPEGADALDIDALYDRLAADGRTYGAAFQAVRAWQLGHELFCEVALAEQQAADGARCAVHPALLDAALHPAIALREPVGAPLALRWTGLRVRQPGALALRVRIAPGEDADVLRLTASDERGAPALSADAIALRPLAPARDAARRDGALEALYRVRWTALAPAPPNGAPPRLLALGDADAVGAQRFDDLAALAASNPPPGAVAVAAPPDARAALALLQGWLAEERLRDARLAVLVRGAAAVRDGESADPDAAAVRGLLRSAQSEHPGRFVTIDGDAPEAIAPAIATGADEIAVRDGAILVPRLARTGGDPPPSGVWRLAAERAGALVGAAPVHGDGDRPLAGGEVRLAVRAAGVNFRDVLVAIGVHGAALGSEAAGIVTEVGPEVTSLAIGDRVMGLVAGAFGPLAVADARTLVPIPAGWSFAQAATVPVAQSTAQLALVDVAGLQAGERVLIHAAAGGVGMAAVALARRLGAEVFATASPAKWDALRALGIDDEHLASSRTPQFASRFRPVDVVLNCLTGELVDASLRLLARGGRFVELGSADVRDAAAVAAAHPNVVYETVDLFGTDARRLGEILAAAAAHAQPLPVCAWDVREGSQALRFMSQARHVGKLVLTVPRALEPDGTVLVTGATGGLGAVVAEHLAREHGVRHLLLVSRRGPDAPGAEGLRTRLAQLGCEATAAACDVGDRAALRELLDAIDPAHPLTAVIHAAGTLDNGMIESFDEARLDGVMRPKAVAARALDDLTRAHDLAAFVLFSSVAATFSHPGQGNYAAANAYLDAVAQRRRAAGLPASAVAWGLWGTGSGMSTRLSREDVEVLAADTGQRVLPADRALALLDVALGHREALLVATTLDLGVLREQARAGVLPALLSDLVRAPGRKRRPAHAGAAGGSLAQQLAGAASPEARQELVLELVRAQAAAVLGHASAADVPPERPFKQLGFDSLGSVVLRNRLTQLSGLRLPSTLVFDHPTPIAMATFMRAQAEQEEVRAPGAAEPVLADAPRPGPPPIELVPLDGPRAGDVAHSTNGDGAHRASLSDIARHDTPAAADRGYRGAVLSSVAGAVRTLRFRAWVLKTRARLARLQCRLVVETDGTPRFDDLPRIVTDAVGQGGGSLTIRIGRDCRFGRELTLDLWTHDEAVLEIGDRCQFQDRIRLQPWGGAIRFGAQVRVRDGAELKSKGQLLVGADSFIGRNTTVHCHERIELADHVNLAEGVNVMDSDHTHDGSDTHVARQKIVSAPVVVESNVFVGTNALILRGSHVGRNVMIATGAVLTGGDYPERYLLAGAPAQPLRPLAPDEPIPS
jgi:acyl transferase domain-containing protein/NADPH:quinone reductase-like Zn-dependent oxidoreductase/acetyltransferase-like isoleucine patch superfamily enzyme/acyl carrier protein